MTIHNSQNQGPAREHGKFRPAISVVTLGVADLARSRAFYEAMGWVPSKSSNDSFTLFTSSGGSMLALYGRQALSEDAGVPHEGSGFRGVATSMNVGTRESVAAVLEQAVRCGGSLVKAAEDVFWGGHRGYFADLDDHLWEVVWNPLWEILDDGRVVPRH